MYFLDILSLTFVLLFYLITRRSYHPQRSVMKLKRFLLRNNLLFIHNLESVTFVKPLVTRSESFEVHRIFCVIT